MTFPKQSNPVCTLNLNIIFVTGDLISLNFFIFSVESASVPDLIPLPYHSSAITNSNSDDGNTEQIPPQSPIEGTEKEHDAIVVDHSPASHTSDFIFPCQPDTVRASGSF